ncbi:MAG: glycosyltransferase family 4 protein [Phycisphaerae bacterium]|jgi:glycosyltransferase involved in cell wall biosynthesis
MRIAFVNQPFDKVRPPFQSSLGIWTYEVARRLQNDHEVTLYVRGGRFRFGELREDGVRYRFVPTAIDRQAQRIWSALPQSSDPKRPRFASDLYHRAFAAAVARDLRRQNCDIVHVLNFSQFIPVLRRHNPATGIVLHMQCDWLAQLDPGILGRRLHDADLVLGCSQYIAENVRLAFPRFQEKCRAVYNGVDTDVFAPNNGAAPRKTDTTKRILFVGRVSPEKGLHVLIEAFNRTRERFPNAHLDIVGPEGAPPREFIVALSDDPKVSDLGRFYARSYRSYLDELIPQEHKDRIAFLGNIPYAELVRRYRSADVFVFPSVWDEPFGMPNIEAMACGVPVIATAGGGIPELVEHGRSGLLVERNNVAELADAMTTLLDDENLRDSMGRAGRARVTERFTWQRIADDLVAEYTTLGAPVPQPVAVG